MTRNLLAIALLPLAFVVGCGLTDNIDCGDNCSDDDDDNGSGEFAATLRSIAPYGWTGKHGAYPADRSGMDYYCENVAECDIGVKDADDYRVVLSGDAFMCAPQVQPVNETDDGSVVSVSETWAGTGICGLAPDGEYSGGWDVETSVEDFLNGFDQVTIDIEQWSAIVTGNSFSYAGTDGDEGDYTVEGSISDDLAEIYFLIIYYDDDGLEVNRLEDTINLED